MSRKVYFVSKENLEIIKRVRTFYLIENGPKNLVGMVDGKPVYLSELVPSNYIYEAEMPDKEEFNQPLNVEMGVWQTQKVDWHNLKESPEDLPKEEGLYFVEIKEKLFLSSYRLLYFNGKGWGTKTQPLGWCKFREGTRSLVKVKAAGGATRWGISNFKEILELDPYAKKLNGGKLVQLSSGEIIRPGDYILG